MTDVQDALHKWLERTTEPYGYKVNVGELERLLRRVYDEGSYSPVHLPDAAILAAIKESNDG